MRAFSAAFLLCLAGAPAAHAALLQPDSAMASSEFSGSYVAENTIDGSGLEMDFTYLSAHDSYAVDNHWTTVGGDVVGASIEWFFDAPQDIFNIVIWNHRSDNIANNPNYEPVAFDLTYRDAMGNALLFLDDADLAPDTATGQVFGGAPILGVSSVLFVVEATQGATPFTGLAEVAFNDASAPSSSVVPLPGAAPLLLAGIGGLLALRRRRG